MGKRSRSAGVIGIQAEVEDESNTDIEAAGEIPPLSVERTTRDTFNQYAPQIISRVMYDQAYSSARANSDEQNAGDECRAAVHRVVMDWGLGELDLLREYSNSDDFKATLYNYVFKRTYLDVKAEIARVMHIPDKKPESNTIQHRNYRALSEIAPEIISGEATHMRYTAGEAFMPLVIERLSGKRISISHYHEQNGDLTADPDMEFVIDTNAGTLSARTFQQDNLGLYQSADGGTNTITNPKLARELDTFARQWFANIRSQEYRKEKMTVESRGEEIEIVHDASGAVKYLNGWTEATDDYARKHNINVSLRHPKHNSPNRLNTNTLYKAHYLNCQRLIWR